MPRYQQIAPDPATLPISKGFCRDINNILKDIQTLDIKETMLFEMRIAEIREIIKTILASPIERESIYDILRTLKPGSDFPVDDSCHLNLTELNTIYKRLSTIERIVACREIYKIVSHKRKMYANEFFDVPEPISAEAESKISYFKNSYADEAYITFSEKLENTRSVNAASFAESCENVCTGRSEYCILPIENTKDGKLATFYSLIYKYELKIAATCSVDFNDEGNSTVFALLQRSTRSIWDNSMSDMFFEIRFIADNYPRISDILIAAEYCSMRPVRIDSTPLPYSNNKFAHHITFSIDSAEMIPFLIYISLDAPQYIPIGIYKHIKPMK